MALLAPFVDQHALAARHRARPRHRAGHEAELLGRHLQAIPFRAPAGAPPFIAMVPKVKTGPGLTAILTGTGCGRLASARDGIDRAAVDRDGDRAAIIAGPVERGEDALIFGAGPRQEGGGGGRRRLLAVGIEQRGALDEVGDIAVLGRDGYLDRIGLRIRRGRRLVVLEDLEAEDLEGQGAAIGAAIARQVTTSSSVRRRGLATSASLPRRPRQARPTGDDRPCFDARHKSKRPRNSRWPYRSAAPAPPW